MNIRHFNYYLHIWFNEFLTLITQLCCWESFLVNFSELISCFRQHLIMHRCPQNILLYLSFKTFDMVNEGDQDLLNKFQSFGAFQWHCMRYMIRSKKYFELIFFLSSSGHISYSFRVKQKFKVTAFQKFFPRIIYFLLHVSSVYLALTKP